MKDIYEISLWEDKLIDATDDVPAHYEEFKIAVIGASTMDAPCRAIEPKLVENVNGTNTFTFKMFYKYNELGKTYDNPFIKLLTNERKVKVFWKEKWYDLVIKNCQEDSSGKSIVYTCKDLFINELSKNGFNIVLDQELNNNQGTAAELCQTVLEGTDWQVGTAETIAQKKEEPVYAIQTLLAQTAHNDTHNTSETIPGQANILVYYQQIQDILNTTSSTGSCTLQFAYAASYQTEKNSQLVLNADCYSCFDAYWSKGTTDISFTVGSATGSAWIKISLTPEVSKIYRAERLVRAQISKFDKLTNKYCKVYTATSTPASSSEYAGLFSKDDKIYGYSTIEFNDVTTITNLIVNGKQFNDTNGWIGDSLKFQLYPEYDGRASYQANSYLRMVSTNTYYNSGLRDSSSFFSQGCSVGERYVYRYKAYTEIGGHPNLESQDRAGRLALYTYAYNSATQSLTKVDYFDMELGSIQDGWYECICTCKKAFSRSDIYNDQITLAIECVQGGSAIWLEEMQFFKEVFGEKEGETVRFEPNSIDVNSVATVKYYYYNYTTSRGLLDPNDIVPIWNKTTDWVSSYITPDYNTNFEKIRSINAKESNRFNMLQDIAQTFECWLRFNIEHDSTGKVIYDNGVPRKTVSIVNTIGQETGIGFIYGIDLKTIARTIQSDQIVTKTIVSPNSNQLAENGTCLIARSEENYPRTNFILNFDYYLSHGLIDSAITNDLYDSTSDIGYYVNLRNNNLAYDQCSEWLVAKHKEQQQLVGYQTIYDGLVTSVAQELQNHKSDLANLANDVWDSPVTNEYINKYREEDSVKAHLTVIINLTKQYQEYVKLSADIKAAIARLDQEISDKEDARDEYERNIKELDARFYKKYSRYIQEGAWKSEDYIDDNLYFLDAQSVAYTSSRPQISYNISVLRLSSLDEYKNKVFHLGDIAYVEDTDFFGYTIVDQLQTPYHEKVLVSEITSNFDDPTKDSFKVQNYKTQFEDLFQRITATTQSLQYASGSYAKAASIVETDGTIKPETLQNSIALNEQLVYSAQHEAIFQDATGITVTDTQNPNKKTKITSGGVFISTDGGRTWKNAIRGEGIATQYLTSGTIATNNITIMDGNYRTFRWDSGGINAYDTLVDQKGVNLSKFVRFDHYGIYGIDNNDEEDYRPDSEETIWNDAKFGMTWNGFFMKNREGNGSVEVSSLNDIQVIGNDIERIKIGRIDGEGTETNPYKYGIRISNASGAPVMETADDGTLWLKNRLNISSTTGTSYNIGLGYLDQWKAGATEGSKIHEVFNANNQFIVYEDGSMKATSGEFTGTIYATGGKIGNMTIDEVEKSVYQVVIESSDGTIFKNGQGTKTLTARLYEGDQNAEITTGTFTYKWYKNGVQISNTTKQITVSADSTNTVYTYTCKVTYTPASS